MADKQQENEPGVTGYFELSALWADFIVPQNGNSYTIKLYDLNDKE